MGRQNKSEKIIYQNSFMEFQTDQVNKRDNLNSEEWKQWKNLSDLWVSQVKKYGNNVMAVAKKDGRWRDFSWREIHEEVKKIALGLISLGMNYRDAVCIFFKPRLEWMETSLGIMLARGI